jgi:hypothetical protein
MPGADPSIYTTRGRITDVMPIPPIPENCYEIPAGPVVFVLESRLLNTAIARDHGERVGRDLGDGIDDAGASLHVLGAADGLEHLRFDCFETHPHYHYVRQVEQLNQILQIDDVIVDPVEWTLHCVRSRLSEMLDYAGAKELAAAVRADLRSVDEAMELVAHKIGELSCAARKASMTDRGEAHFR